MLFYVEVTVADGDREGYSSNQVCDATGLRRTTLDAWVLRRYLDLSSGPGTGRERRFTLDETILIAVAVELTRLGLSVGVAAHSANYFARLAAERNKPSIQKGEWLLLIGQAPRSKPVEIDAPSLTPLALIKSKSLQDLRQFVKEKFRDPTTVIITDVSRIARTTVEQLEAVAPGKKGRPNASKRSRKCLAAGGLVNGDAAVLRNAAPPQPQAFLACYNGADVKG